jgi:anaerobic magnesium-protoporphyrin IX monomethyl ester cyclase
MILLLNPPHPPGCTSNKDTMGGFGQIYDDPLVATLPPLDLYYIGAVLRKNNIAAKILDCGPLSLTIEDLLAAIKTDLPRIVGVRISTPTYEWDLGIIQKIKSECNVQIVVFGPHATMFEQKIISNQSVDMVILGEPEYAFYDLAKKQKENIEGLVYKENGVIFRNTKVRIIDDLDELPFPAWDMIPVDSFSLGRYANGQQPFFTILASRGCPYGCKYCPYPIAQGKKWRARSADNVVAEIQYLIDGFGMRGLLFRDPEFTADNSRVKAICEQILEKKLSFSWRCETRIDTVNEELLTLMARAGCVGINFGVESVTDKVLEGVGRKKIAPKDILEQVGTCKRLGIDTFCFFIIGLPDDDAETILDNIHFALALNPTAAQFTVFTPYFGTELGRWYEEHGLIEQRDLDAMTSYRSMVRTEKLTQSELQKFRDMASEMWELNVKTRNFSKLKQKAEELDYLKSRSWYKISFACRRIIRQITSFVC